ncbi:5'-methylthioadenosine phosphorylase [Bipolaris maydis]|nr:5'-methylthioadenosine phosphorylase [Bipolaris maydis]
MRGQEYTQTGGCMAVVILTALSEEITRKARVAALRKELAVLESDLASIAPSTQDMVEQLARRECLELSNQIMSRLPREVRDMIYLHLSTRDVEIIEREHFRTTLDPLTRLYSYNFERWKKQHFQEHYWNPEYVSKPLYNELVENYYRTSTFVFSDDPGVMKRFLTTDEMRLGLLPKDLVAKVEIGLNAVSHDRGSFRAYMFGVPKSPERMREAVEGLFELKTGARAVIRFVTEAKTQEERDEHCRGAMETLFNEAQREKMKKYKVKKHFFLSSMRMAGVPSTYDGAHFPPLPLAGLVLTFSAAPVHIAVIGGTGISSLPGFTLAATLDIDTPWGKPSSPISILQHPSPTTGKPIPVAFLSRHGLYHELAPHEVKNQANIAALRHIGVRTIIAFSAVGSLQEHVRPRDFLVPDQIIDRTKGIRPFTFFEGGMVGHVGFGDPFDKRLAAIVRQCGHALEGEGVTLHDNGTLICMEGPQFSTRAESNLYRSWGGSVINMSALPEAKLAREAEIGYQMICMATDYDCWRGDGEEDVNVEMVMAHMKANAENARRFVGAVLNELSKEEHVDQVLAKHLDGQMRFAGAMTKKEGRGQEAEKKLQWLFPGYFD